jgi:VIT1/CCC1 family predicted Fe2+/Mn2+ transporter
MLVAAIGCNLAWGIIDAVFYLMGCMADTGRSLLTYRAVRRTSDPRQAESLIAEALPKVVAAVLRPEELASIRYRLQQLPEPPAQPRLSRADFSGALGVFLLVFLSTFPVAVPFIFMNDHLAAMRLSNAIAVVMLFIAGFAYGRYIGRQPWLLGAAMVLLGSVLVALTIALGG